jgi:hypothetical protein
VAAVVGVTLVKRFTYRGDSTEEFSNQYWFSGSVPADSTAWLALVDALVTQEKKVYHSGVSVVAAYGYDSDDPAAVAAWVGFPTGTPVAGTMATTGGTKTAGDQAVWVRWKTSRLNSRGKAIYLRKYFHGALWNTATNPDDVLVAQYTALSAFATKLWDGSFIDGRTIRSQSHSETITSSGVGAFITTRTLKRRGKRPSS